MYEPDIATMAIGQGIAVTPLQMLRAICAIANGGELLEPYIIDKIVMPDGRVLRQGQRKVVRRVITEDVAGQMRRVMEKVVSEGGGKPAHIAGYQIAGKTGTAEKLAEQGGYAPGEYIASFVGFVPAANPQYAMLVMLIRRKVRFTVRRYRRRYLKILCSRYSLPKAFSRARTKDCLRLRKMPKTGPKPLKCR